MKYLDVRVARKLVEATGVVSFELRDVADRELAPFTAGAHIDVLIRDGLTRQYSLCNPPGERHRYLIGVLRCADSRGGSVAMHDDLVEGAVVRISEPRNLFPVRPAQYSMLFAGGIGITPILCMAEELSMAGAEFELHYSARSPDHAAFRSRMAAAPFANRVRYHYDNGQEDQKLRLDDIPGLSIGGTHLYVCGPAGYIGFVTDWARSLGWPDDRIHFEHFSQKAVPPERGDAFIVEIAGTGQRYVVPPERSILEVLQTAGVGVPSSCEQGVCGTCLTRVLGGEPDHRDIFQSDEERSRNDQIAVCCSRSRSPILVLDL